MKLSTLVRRDDGCGYRLVETYRVNDEQIVSLVKICDERGEIPPELGPRAVVGADTAFSQEEAEKNHSEMVEDARLGYFSATPVRDSYSREYVILPA